MHHTGKALTQNFNKAMQLFREAAEHGHADTQMQMRLV